MNEFVLIIKDKIEHWPRYMTELCPRHIAVASNFHGRTGPSFLAPDVWKEPIDKILKEYFTVSSNVWKVYIIFGQLPEQELEGKSEGQNASTKVRQEKKNKSQIKKEPRIKTEPQIKSETRLEKNHGLCPTSIQNKRSLSEVLQDIEDGEEEIDVEEVDSGESFQDMNELLREATNEESKKAIHDEVEEKDRDLDAPASRTRFKRARK